MLLAKATDLSREWLAAHRDDPIAATALARFRALCTRRESGEPIAYLVEAREFYGRRFRVTPDVLIPRPETELLVDRVLAWLRAAQPEDAHGGYSVVDLGTGSGAIAATIALEMDRSGPPATVWGTDFSPAAWAVARANAEALGARVQLVESDWFAAFGSAQERRDLPSRFDCIVSNPPYIAAQDRHLTQGDLRFEPRMALTDESDGLAAIRRIVAGAPFHLLDGGALFLEHGYDQADNVRAMLVAAGFADVRSWRDLAGIERVAAGSAFDAAVHTSGICNIMYR